MPKTLRPKNFVHYREDILPGDSRYLAHASDQASECGAYDGGRDNGGKGYECTREKGHKPPHAAHGGTPMYATWETEEEVPNA